MVMPFFFLTLNLIAICCDYVTSGQKDFVECFYLIVVFIVKNIENAEKMWELGWTIDKVAI